MCLRAVDQVDVAIDIVAFSQRDPRWRDEMLGTGDLSIGQAGCLLSAAAGLLASWGMATDPHRLNEFVKRSFGFIDDNLFVFASVDGLGCRFIELIDCERTPAPVERLVQAVVGGYGVLACVDAAPGGTLQRHWVRVVAASVGSGGSDGSSGWMVVDPWMLPGQEIRNLAAYLASGWDPARGIFAAAIYERLVGNRGMAWRCDVEAVQPVVCVRSFDSGLRPSAQDDKVMG